MKLCKSFNHFYVILSQMEIRYSDAVGGWGGWGATGIISLHFLSHTPFPSILRCSIGRYNKADISALHLLCHNSLFCSSDFITGKKARRLRGEALPFDPITDSRSYFCSQNRKTLCSHRLDSPQNVASEMLDLSVALWFLSSCACNSRLSVMQTSVKPDSRIYSESHFVFWLFYIK